MTVQVLAATDKGGPPPNLAHFDSDLSAYGLAQDLWAARKKPIDSVLGDLRSGTRQMDRVVGDQLRMEGRSLDVPMPASGSLQHDWVMDAAYTGLYVPQRDIWTPE